MASNLLDYFVAKQIQFEPANLGGQKMKTVSYEEQRLDWSMRRFVSDVIQYLQHGGDHANARMNMTERGVPFAVQSRVIDGLAVREPH